MTAIRRRAEQQVRDPWEEYRMQKVLASVKGTRNTQVPCQGFKILEFHSSKTKDLEAPRKGVGGWG